MDPKFYVTTGWQAYFIATSRELTRIDSVTKAPVIHHFSESVAGFSVIRSFQKQGEFAQVNVERVDSNLRLDFHNNAANEWLGYRLEMIGTIVLCTSALLVVALPQKYINPGKKKSRTLHFLRYSLVLPSAFTSFLGDLVAQGMGG